MHGITDTLNYKNIANAIREKNGSQEVYKPNEMASAIEELKVGELDFSSIYDKNQAKELNQYYKDGIEYAEGIKRNWDENRTDRREQFKDNLKVIFFPNVNFSKSTHIQQLFYGCVNLISISGELVFNSNNPYYLFSECSSLIKSPKISFLKKPTEMQWVWQNCRSLISCEYIDTSEVTSFVRCWYNCISLPLIKIGSVEKCTNFSTAFYNTLALTSLEFDAWKQADVNLAQSSKLSAGSIKYIIWHSLNGNNILGFENQEATSRTLTLQKATTHDVTWVSIKDTTPSVEDCKMLGIDESEITKYSNLTWARIASEVKLITITG